MSLYKTNQRKIEEESSSKNEIKAKCQEKMQEQAANLFLKCSSDWNNNKFNIHKNNGLGKEANVTSF